MWKQVVYHSPCFGGMKLQLWISETLDKYKSNEYSFYDYSSYSNFTTIYNMNICELKLLKIPFCFSVFRTSQFVDGLHYLIIFFFLFVRLEYSDDNMLINAALLIITYTKCSFVVILERLNPPKADNYGSVEPAPYKN